MSRYNHLINDHFRSCLLLAKAYDPHRNRQVMLRAIPGQFEFVGVSDGVDAWIAPAVASCFSVNVQRILQDLQNGKMPVVDQATGSRPRSRVLPNVLKEPEQAPSPAPRVRVTVEKETVRRVHVQA